MKTRFHVIGKGRFERHGSRGIDDPSINFPWFGSNLERCLAPRREATGRRRQCRACRGFSDHHVELQLQLQWRTIHVEHIASGP